MNSYQYIVFIPICVAALIFSEPRRHGTYWEGAASTRGRHLLLCTRCMTARSSTSRHNQQNILYSQRRKSVKEMGKGGRVRSNDWGKPI
jgi:hypothetical protein